MSKYGWDDEEDDYAPPVIAGRTGTPPANDAPALLAVMAVVAAGMFLALKLGFIVHGDPQPAPLASPALTAAAAFVLSVGIVFGVRWAIRSRSGASARVRRETEAYVSEVVAARNRRVAELASNPATAQYAARAERGEDWSDENIAYYENPRAVATCEHLQPIERAMREAGIVTRKVRHGAIEATCRIDLDALRTSFRITAPVRYAEFYAGDRDEQEHPTAFIICDMHTSMVHTLHPDEASAFQATLFPQYASGFRPLEDDFHL